MIIIQSPTPNLKQSKEFYSKLGFAILDTQLGFLAAAKNLEIEITTTPSARVGLKMFRDDWSEFVNKNNSLKYSKTEDGYLLTSPAGCCVYLVNGTDLTLNKLENDAILGNFAGLSIETNSMHDSLLFWERFGFKQNSGNIEHGWATLKNEEGFKISLMKYGICPHLFFNPSLNFFNGSANLSIIAKLRELEIPFAQEITSFNEKGIVDNIIIRDSGGLGAFIFSD